MHPIFMAVLRRPELLADHLANYAELVRADLSAVAGSLRIRAVGAAVALVALPLALGLTGIAAMLRYVYGEFHWALVAVPGAAWLSSAVGAMLAMRSGTAKVVDVKSEMEADFNMLRLVKEAKDD